MTEADKAHALIRAKHYARKTSDLAVELEELQQELDDAGAEATAEAVRTITDGLDEGIQAIYSAIKQEE